MKSQRGFTLVEMLVTFAILLVILAFITPMLQVLYHNTNKEFNQLEWQIFIQQAKMEIREANGITLSNQNKKLTFTNINNQLVSYEIFQDKIRRRVDGTGNEILLQKIRGVIYERRNNGFLIIVETVDGDRYEALVTVFIEVEVSEI